MTSTMGSTPTVANIRGRSIVASPTIANTGSARRGNGAGCVAECRLGVGIDAGKNDSCRLRTELFERHRHDAIRHAPLKIGLVGTVPSRRSTDE